MYDTLFIFTNKNYLIYLSYLVMSYRIHTFCRHNVNIYFLNIFICHSRVFLSNSTVGLFKRLQLPFFN